jgi:hypothetical protein
MPSLSRKPSVQKRWPETRRRLPGSAVAISVLLPVAALRWSGGCSDGESEVRVVKSVGALQVKSFAKVSKGAEYATATPFSSERSN